MSNFIQENRGYIAGGVALSALYPAMRAVGFGAIALKDFASYQVVKIRNNQHGNDVQFKKILKQDHPELIRKLKKWVAGTQSYNGKRDILKSVLGQSVYEDMQIQKSIFKLSRTYMFRNLGWVAGILGAAGLLYWALTPSSKQ